MNQDEVVEVSEVPEVPEVADVAESVPQPANMPTLQVGQKVYLRNRANPFIPTGGSPDWNRNELTLKDSELRVKAGVSQLDQSITDAYAANPKSSRF